MPAEEEGRDTEVITMDSSPDGSSRKRKQPTENASGPAWGALSFAAAKTSAINKSMKESGKDPGFGDFGRYFSEKQRKLREQFLGDASTSMLRDVPTEKVAQYIGPKIDDDLSDKSDSREVNKKLFKGVSIFVDGFTSPTHQELRFLMMNHGGVFQNYFSSQRVTHVICSILPDSKILNPRMLSRGLPIVKPEWIVDCINANALLPWCKYQLERLAYSHPHQRTLSASYLNHRSEEKSSSTATANGAKMIAHSDLEKWVDIKEQRYPIKETKELELKGLSHHTGGPIEAVLTNPSEAEGVETLEGETAAQNLVPPSPASKLQCTDLVERALHHGSHRGNVQSTDSPEANVPVQQANRKIVDRRGHSTLSDPDFVHSYFKYSRLHFIGTWRTRYQSLVNAGTFGQPKKAILDGEAAATSSRRSPVIIHIDMDCFFVSVVARDHPALNGKPVAVCHSESAQGTGEISSANYPARSYGIKAGMFVRDAKALCPDLTIVPYDFPAYEQVADKVYSILHHHCSTVQAVSCDEAYLDVTGHPDPSNLAMKIREEIFESTKCTASIGIAENLLLARLATKKAKPNGQYFIAPHQVKEFIAVLPLDQLPGVGWNLQEKLYAHGLHTCADLQSVPKGVLQRDYGTKTGMMLWSYCRGIDEREVQPAQDRKSIGAEVNWGVRFSCMDDADQFLVTLSNEVAARLVQASSSGRTITLKVKRRKEGAGEPYKYMGCGACDNFSRSETVAYATSSADMLLRISRQLFASFNLDVQEVRGVGLQVSRLQSTNTGSKKQYNELKSWFAHTNQVSLEKDKISRIACNIRSKEETEQQRNSVDDRPEPSTVAEEILSSERPEQDQNGQIDLQVPVVSGRQTLKDQFQRQIKSKRKENPRDTSLELPPLSQLDRSVLEFLPEDIVAEINEAGRAQEEKKQRESEQRALQEAKQKEPEWRTCEVKPRIIPEVQKPPSEQLHTRRSKCTKKPKNSLLALPPESHLDPFVLKSLPDDILAEIKYAYEQERLRNPSRAHPSNLYLIPQEIPASTLGLMETPVKTQGMEDNSHRSNNDLKPRKMTCQNLELLTQSTVHFDQTDSLQVNGHAAYFSLLQSTLQPRKAGNFSQDLSSRLLYLGSYLPITDRNDITGLEELVQHCLRLLIQYIQNVAINDLEEMQLVLLHTKRLGTRCKLWRAVQGQLLPAVQAVVSELYGGKLTLD